LRNLFGYIYGYGYLRTLISLQRNGKKKKKTQNGFHEVPKRQPAVSDEVSKRQG